MNIRKKIRDRYNSVEIPQASDVLPAGTASRNKRKGDRGGVKLFIELAASAAVIVFIFGAVLAGQGMLKRQNALPLGDLDTTDTEAYQTTVRNDFSDDTGSEPALTSGNADTGSEPALTSGRADTEDHGTGAPVETEGDTTTPHVTDPPDVTDEKTTVVDTEPEVEFRLGLTGDEDSAGINETLVGRKLSEIEAAFGKTLFTVDGDKANEKLAKNGWALSSIAGVKLCRIPYDSKNDFDIGVSKSTDRVLWVHRAFKEADDSYDVLLLRKNFDYDEHPISVTMVDFPPKGHFTFEPEYEILCFVAGMNEADLISRWGEPVSAGKWLNKYGTYEVNVTFNSEGFADGINWKKVKNPQGQGVERPGTLEAAVKMTDKNLTAALKDMPGYALTELWGIEGAAFLITPGQAEPTGSAWIHKEKIIVIRMSDEGHLTSASVRDLSDLLYDGQREYAVPISEDVDFSADSEIVMPVMHNATRIASRHVSERWLSSLYALEYDGVWIPDQSALAYTVDAGFLPDGGEIVYYGGDFSNDVTYLFLNGKMTMLTFCEKNDEGEYVINDDSCVNCFVASPVTRFMPIYSAGKLVGFVYSYTDSLGIQLGVCDLVRQTAEKIGTVRVSDKNVTAVNGAGEFSAQSEISYEGGFLIRTETGFELLAGSARHPAGSSPTGAKYTLSIKSSGVEITAG